MAYGSTDSSNGSEPEIQDRGKLLPQVQTPGLLGPKEGLLDAIIGNGYNPREVRFVLLAAVLIALNTGFVNGVTLSGFLSDEIEDPRDPDTATTAGVAGYVTKMSTNVNEYDWARFQYNICMLLSYFVGSMITGILSPRAKSYAMDPLFGPSFLIGGTMLFASSLLSAFEYPTQYVYYLAIAANGVQNGVASIYSANLIRCTLTGAVTDIGIIVGQCLRGNPSSVARGIVLSIIVTSFLVGGLISYSMVRTFTSYTLLFNAVLFYSVGVLLIFFLKVSLKVSLTDAIFGKWTWKSVLKKIQPTGDKYSMMNMFNELDYDRDGFIDLYEFQKGLEDKVSDEELKTLIQAADTDGTGRIDKDEWTELIHDLFEGNEN